jgi:uncharacterized protein YjbI with pentapeptide repeats
VVADPTPSPRGGRPRLQADCASCFGLCCVALPFTASADFAIDKEAGQPCLHLRADFRCGIHALLRDRGFPGCAVFDCFGAGQQVSQVTFGGRDWREAPDTATQMFAIFPIMRQLHELLWYLTEALRMPPARPIHNELRHALIRVDRLTRSSPDALMDTDMAALRAGVHPLLQQTSELVRAALPGRKRRHHGADLIGANLKGADLRAADLHGAYLIAADLRDADLRLADLRGADLRNADLSGCSLTDAIFLTQPQINSAKGDLVTRLPAMLRRPPHWERRRASSRTSPRSGRQHEVHRSGPAAAPFRGAGGRVPRSPT